MTQLDFIFCGPVFRDALREMDFITFDGVNNQFVIILPETNSHQAVLTVQRLTQILGKKLAVQLSFGIAEFPADGLNINDLLSVAMTSSKR